MFDEVPDGRLEPGGGAGTGNNQASIIIVEVIGYGGGDGDDERRQGRERRKDSGQRTYVPDSSVGYVGSARSPKSGSKC